MVTNNVGSATHKPDVIRQIDQIPGAWDTLYEALSFMDAPAAKSYTGCFIELKNGRLALPQNVKSGTGVGSAGTTRTPS